MEDSTSRAGGEAPASSAPFNPHQFLTQISGKDYLEVKWRLLWLRTEHPDAVIETEMVKEDGTTAVFKARVTLPGGGSATGWGSETYQDFGDYIEKAETKALGRALGALGFGTQFSYDFDYGAEQGRVVDSPIDVARVGRSTTGGQAPRPVMVPGRPAHGQHDGATERQIKAVYAIGRAVKLSDDEIRRRCGEAYGSTPEGLSRRDASTFIDLLKQEMGS